jgi:hypothetical protein
VGEEVSADEAFTCACDRDGDGDEDCAGIGEGECVGAVWVKGRVVSDPWQVNGRWNITCEFTSDLRSRLRRLQPEACIPLAAV